MHATQTDTQAEPARSSSAAVPAQETSVIVIRHGAKVDSEIGIQRWLDDTEHARASARGNQLAKMFSNDDFRPDLVLNAGGHQAIQTIGSMVSRTSRLVVAEREELGIIDGFFGPSLLQLMKESGRRDPDAYFGYDNLQVYLQVIGFKAWGAIQEEIQKKERARNFPRTVLVVTSGLLPQMIVWAADREKWAHISKREIGECQGFLLKLTVDSFLCTEVISIETLPDLDA
jgi:hypothetical protein